MISSRFSNGSQREVNLLFTYFSDEEYHRVFGEFEGVRKKIATLIAGEMQNKNLEVLDLLAGHGYLSAELAQVCPNCMIHGTGLKNDLDSFTALKASGIYPSSVWKNISYTKCDVTTLPFDN
ncbi:MAG: hypothetical protein ACFFAY_00690, partial [Promethearchaeota archaeon]